LGEQRSLGKYRIDEVLGKGAMGVVYRAFDPTIERQVALKTIRKDLLDRDQGHELVARFKTEAQAGGRLAHPGIVSVYEYGEDDDVAYIAMEFVSGRGLGHYLAKQERFSLADTMSIMAQLLDALDYAHDRGVVHRDIKPANIIMTGDGGLKVADFGIARLDNSSLTQVGAVMGTPSYMSPEQFAGLPVDRRSDLFSAGVILYELLTGQKPFQGATETISYKVCHVPHRDPSELDPDAVPALFNDVLSKALAKKPEDRYEGAGEFAEALCAAYEARDSAAPDLEPTLYNDSPAASPLPERGDTTTYPPTQWPVEHLRAIEQLLAPHVGPMAKILVKKAAKVSAEGQQLVSLLAAHVDDEADRQVFVAAALAKVIQVSAANPGGAATGAGARAGTREPIAQADIDKAAGALVTYIGPIAKIMAKKAAAAASGRLDFHQRLAEAIADPDDRARFLQDVGRS
jgi:serine/threonine-protein kinase